VIICGQMMDFPSAARATPLLCVWGSARSPQGVRLIGKPRRDNVLPGGCQKAGMAYRAITHESCRDDHWQ
jgi:hypothetical protein